MHRTVNNDLYVAKGDKDTLIFTFIGSGAPLAGDSVKLVVGFPGGSTFINKATTVSNNRAVFAITGTETSQPAGVYHYWVRGNYATGYETYVEGKFEITEAMA